MRRIATSLLVVSIALSTLSVSGAVSALCTSAQQSTTGCPPKNTGTEIIIEDSRDIGGTPIHIPVGDRGPGGEIITAPDPRAVEFTKCLHDWDSYIRCFRGGEDEEPDEESEDETVPSITISDLVRFAPLGTALAGEPENVGVAGLPTNFVAAASVHTVSETLFDLPVTVRFTPASYDYAFGDGATLTTAVAGKSWEQLGQAQFTPTPTSHTYGERGTYLASVDLRYTAEVDFGIGWFPIPGEVTVAGQPQEVRVFEAHTALVAYTCEQSPRSPGC